MFDIEKIQNLLSQVSGSMTVQEAYVIVEKEYPEIAETYVGACLGEGLADPVAAAKDYNMLAGSFAIAYAKGDHKAMAPQRWGGLQDMFGGHGMGVSDTIKREIILWAFVNYQIYAVRHPNHGVFLVKYPVSGVPIHPDAITLEDGNGNTFADFPMDNQWECVLP